MKHLVPFLCLAAMSLLGLNSCVSRYYIVRHAEKDTSVPDIPGPTGQPLLAPQGVNRSLALRDSLQNKNVKHIFVSQFLRTQLTAAPTATALGIVPVHYDAQADQNLLSAQLRAVAGNSVLVVGHSNTVPGLVTSLTGVNLGYTSIPDSEYHNLYIIKRYKCLGPARYTLERHGSYGAITP